MRNKPDEQMTTECKGQSLPYGMKFGDERFYACMRSIDSICIHRNFIVRGPLKAEFIAASRS